MVSGKGSLMSEEYGILRKQILSTFFPNLHVISTPFLIIIIANNLWATAMFQALCKVFYTQTHLAPQQPIK